MRRPIRAEGNGPSQCRSGEGGSRRAGMTDQTQVRRRRRSVKMAKILVMVHAIPADHRIVECLRVAALARPVNAGQLGNTIRSAGARHTCRRRPRLNPAPDGSIVMSVRQHSDLAAMCSLAR